MKSDLYTAIAQIAAERGIPREAVQEAVEQALRTVYKKVSGSDDYVDVVLDSNTGAYEITGVKRVVDEVEDPSIEITL